MVDLDRIGADGREQIWVGCTGKCYLRIICGSLFDTHTHTAQFIKINKPFLADCFLQQLFNEGMEINTYIRYPSITPQFSIKGEGGRPLSVQSGTHFTVYMVSLDRLVIKNLNFVPNIGYRCAIHVWR